MSRELALTGGNYQTLVDNEVVSDHTQYGEAVQSAVNQVLGGVEGEIRITMEPVRVEVSGREEAPEPEGETNKEPLKIGVNLADVSYWGSQAPFANVMRMSVKAGNSTPDDRVYRWWFEVPHPPPFTDADKYTAEFTGSGRVEMHFEGYSLEIHAFGEVNDLKVWMPGYGPGEPRDGQIFYQGFLDRLEPFAVIRFMDWQNTNHSEIREWSERTRLDQWQTWDDLEPAGVPIETMIALCNRLNANPWLCVPRFASADYVRQFAKLVNAKLEPGLKVYVEYSNEVWNWNFVVDKQPVSVDGDGGGPVIGFNAQGQEHIDHDGWASRMLSAFTIFEDVCGPERVVRVLAGQAANVWQAEQVIERTIAATQGTPAYPGFDAISCAAYFGVSPGEIPADATAKDILRIARQSLVDGLSQLEEHAALAAKYGVPFVAYEAGSHIVGDDDAPYWSAYVKAHRIPEMYDLYIDAMAQFERVGGDLWVAFNFARIINKNGAWGQLEYIDQPLEDAPKYRALVSYGEGAGQ